jgi:DnaJ-class molecular chaperone
MVLWKELEWVSIGLGELIAPGKVKLRYMKAVSKLHPDKLRRGTGVREEMVAAQVFSALNEAWEAFKADNGMI